MNKKAIELLEEIEKVHLEGKCKGVCEQGNFLSQAIKWGEAMDSAEGELPERLEAICAEGVGYVKAHNDLLDIAQPILAKAYLRIAELEQKLIDKTPKL